jgi:hypothetical protein
MQVMHDTATFGAFVDSFLTSFCDEFSKRSFLTFPLLSDTIPGHIDIDDVSLHLGPCVTNTHDSTA